jgi:hypothetical protein
MPDITPPSKTSVDLARLLLRMLDRPGMQLIELGFRGPETPPEQHGAGFTIILGEDSGLTPVVVQYLRSIIASAPIESATENSSEETTTADGEAR